MNDLYEVLQVRRGAEPEVIRAAYRALARKHHPDFGGAPERMAAINGAWAARGDQARRVAYDASSQASVPASAHAAASSNDAPNTEPHANGTGRGLAARRRQDQRHGGTV